MFLDFAFKAATPAPSGFQQASWPVAPSVDQLADFWAAYCRAHGTIPLGSATPAPSTSSRDQTGAEVAHLVRVNCAKED